MRYREFDPIPALRPVVRCYWLLQSPSANAVHANHAAEQVLPDGCAEIILNRADAFRRQRAGAGHVQARILLVGQIENSITVEPTGAVDLLGIRFQPHGLGALLGSPMHELTDIDLCLGQVDRQLHAALLEACEPEHVDQRLAAVQAVLLQRMSLRESALASANQLAGHALKRMQRAPSTIQSLARSLGVSRRTLERAFRQQVGLSPLLYARIMRLQGVLQRLDRGAPSAGWADLALAHGYSDQSHLIRDFRLIAGTTPERHLAERTPLQGALVSGELSHSSNPASSSPG